ncbi:MAG: 3-hydroxyacyl-CoA dehydrogenase NAD-binding domain-containing protein [Pirellulaceae bacterium]
MTDSDFSPHEWPPRISGRDRPLAASHVARLIEQAKHHPAAQQLGPHATHIQTVGICGAGVMGTAIATANVLRGIRVKLYDAAGDALDRAQAMLVAELASAAGTPPAPALVECCRAPEQLADCDLLIETVAENRELKQRIFRQLAPHLTPATLLTTNTSTIRLADLSTAAPDPTRFCGLHFCNPVHVRPLVEIVRSNQTSAATVASVVAYVIRLDKLPVVVRDSPGFLVNRLLFPYLNEALEMLCQGVDLEAIDRAGREFGMALGPLEMLDMIGVDTAMRAGRTLWDAFPERMALTPILPRLVKLGRLGRKTGVGFYSYPSADSQGVCDPTFTAILEPYVRRTRPVRDDEIAARLFLPMLLEATRALEEQVVEQAHDVDLAMLFGLAFPQSHGGLLYWADGVGAARILEILQPLAALGPRMHPTPLLRALAASGSRFYR